MHLLCLSLCLFCLVIAAPPKDDKKEEKKGILGQVTDTVGRGLNKGRWGSLNDLRKKKFMESFGRTNPDKFHKVLQRARKDMKKRIKMSEKDVKDMEQLLKKHKRKGRRERLRAKGDRLLEVNQALGLSENFYQGDMILTNEQIDVVLAPFTGDDEAPSSSKTKRQAYKDSRYPGTTWGNTVYYYFDGTMSADAKKAATLAMEFWQNNTCINFVQSTTQSNRIRFYMGEGCYSYVGKIGGVQDVSIGQGCESMGTAAHEIGHALGFFHTQSRNDRDYNIYVDLAQIVSGWEDQFNKETEKTNFNYGKPYDYGSIMQYGGSSASGTGKPTMLSRSYPYQDTMGSDIVSFYDVDMMNEHYNCKAKCTSGATCRNGGIRNSRNCNVCICPRGWAGTTCNQRPVGCGTSVTATASAQKLSVSAGDDKYVIEMLFRECNWQITAPAGKKVEVTISAIERPLCYEGCVYGGLELKVSGDQRMSGIRYCCAEDVRTVVVSESNVMPVIAFNRYNKNVYTLSYRYVEASTPSTVTAVQKTTP